MQLNLDAILPDEVTYDRKSKRFRYTESGRFVSRERTLELQRSFIDKLTEQLKGFAQPLVDGEIGAQRDTAETLKKIHLNQAAIARGGVDNLTEKDLGQVGATLKKQYYQGKDENTGKRYGLRHLVNDIKNLDLSVAKVAYRLGLYAKSGKISYYQTELNAKLDEGFTTKKRALTPGHVHCIDCIRYDSLGYVNISDSLPFPTQRCECRVNCECEMKYQ